MQRQPTDPILNWRLEAIQEAQKRSRVAFFLSTLAAGAILASVWNVYLSWDRQWADVRQKPADWGQELVLAEQIKAWVETNTVAVSLLGIRLSVSDIAVLGSIVLLIFSFYFCMCMRRENQEIGTLLADVKDSSPEVRHFVYLRIRSFMVFNTVTDNDTPLSTLAGPPPETKHIPFSRSGFKAFIYLPVLTVALIILSDIYFGFFYVSPWRVNEGSAWNTFTRTYRIQFVAMDVFAVLVGLLIYNYCRHAVSYHRATRQVIEEFSALPGTTDPDATERAV